MVELHVANVVVASSNLVSRSKRKSYQMVAFFINYVFYIYNTIGKTNRFYIGYTKDITKRLERHNDGWSKSTKSWIPWKIVYSKKFTIKSDAMKFERKLKSYKSRIILERLINESKNK